MSTKGSALVITILLIALAGVLAMALADLGRLALGRARLERDGVRAWFLAEGALAETLAALPAGHSFTDALRTAPGPPPPAGDPWTVGIGFRDDADDAPADDTADVNARVILRISAFGPSPVRRRLEAVLGRARDPLLPGALTLAGDVRTLTADFLLDGRDFDMATGCTLAAEAAPRAGLTLPEGAVLPLLTSPDQVRGAGDAPSITRGPAPAFDEVAAAEDGDHAPAGALASTLGDETTPRFVIVDGDAVAAGTTTGVGALYVAGRLEVTGRLAFRGIVAAEEGITLAPSGVLEICGGAWAAGSPALEAAGTGFIRASRQALRLAATLAPLPAPARVIAVREAS